MGFFDIIDYQVYKQKGIKYSNISDKQKPNNKFEFYRVSYLAYDEILEELSAVKKKNQELEAKLDKLIQLLESK